MHSSMIKQWVPLIARILLGGLFVFAGWGKIVGFTATAGYIASVGLPMPSVLTVLAIIIELGGGLMLIAGFMARLASWMLVVFTLIATALFHNNFADQMQLMMALKNLSITGGLLLLAVNGPGPKSMKCWCAKCSGCGNCHVCDGACGTDQNHGQ
ncbi:MAG: DoxX family protein [Patescibacteria group bacterium]